MDFGLITLQTLLLSSIASTVKKPKISNVNGLTCLYYQCTFFSCFFYTLHEAALLSKQHVSQLNSHSLIPHVGCMLLSYPSKPQNISQSVNLPLNELVKKFVGAFFLVETPKHLKMSKSYKVLNRTVSLTPTILMI